MEIIQLSVSGPREAHDRSELILLCSELRIYVHLFSFLPPSSAPISPTDLEESWQGLGVGGGRGAGKLDSQLIPPREVESEESSEGNN